MPRPMRAGCRPWRTSMTSPTFARPLRFKSPLPPASSSSRPASTPRSPLIISQKRGRLLAALEAAGMEPTVPPGAHYIMASAERLPGNTAAEKARHLLRATGVAAVAGSAFFRPGRGENLLRFCFAKLDSELDDACARLRKL